MILVAWTIVLAAAVDPLFPDARGLSMGGNAANSVAFLLFSVGIVTVIWVVGVIAYKCLVVQPETES
jgi:ABC-type Mn2+/Zn2+ transport system permease subunit